MREVNGSELLEGSDHEFVVNLYTMILNRWPDEEGYRHHLEKIENRPNLRRQLIKDVANSAEARSLAVVLRFESDPPPAAAPQPAPAAAAPPAPVATAAPAKAPPIDLAAALAALREGMGDMSLGDLAAAKLLLGEAMAVIAAHQAERLEARLAALERRAR